MGTSVVFRVPGRVGLIEYPEEPLAEDEVRLGTLYSGISAGTELTAYRGTNLYLHKRWDPELRLFVADGETLSYPLQGWGYEEVGEVVEVGRGVSRVRPGQVVWGAWGHRSTRVVTESWAAERLLPEGLEPLCGIFSRIGSVALNAVLDADIHVGEDVAVFGQGVAGLIVTQLARANGGRVIAVEAVPLRLEAARRVGASHVVDFGAEDPAPAIRRLTGGRGADVSIEVSGSYRALHEAIRSTAYGSRVVSCGFFQGEARDLALGEEFHHNRIEVVCSQTSGVSPRLAHRWDRLRLERTVMDLQARGVLDLRPLVTHVVPATRAEEAFRLLDERPEEALQVVLEFGTEGA